jgi:hypothetical protein
VRQHHWIASGGRLSVGADVFIKGTQLSGNLARQREKWSRRTQYGQGNLGHKICPVNVVLFVNASMIRKKPQEVVKWQSPVWEAGESAFAIDEVTFTGFCSPIGRWR